ncbi:MAG TPA: FAD-dependent oxidoreductase [Pirellulales bacterium]|nr:FAD-dependent oxidoreductase [Pirellulales bacterium]
MTTYGLPYWLDFERPAFPTLEGDATADVAIIGAGIAGLKLARYLSRHGMSAIVLEGAKVGEGASGRNQGTINHSPNLGYSQCIRLHSRRIARDLWRLGLENHRLLREQIADYGIDCDYVSTGQTNLVRRDAAAWEDTLAAYLADYELLRDDGFDVAWIDERDARRVGGSPLYAGGLHYAADAQFHSGKFVIGLARGVAREAGTRVVEGVRVERIERAGGETRVVAGGHSVTAPVVFLATNALAPRYAPTLERSLRAERGQVLVTEPLAERPCAGSFGTSLAWWREIREADGRFRLLFGGGRARDEPDSLFPQFQANGRPHPKLEIDGFSPSAEHQRRLDAQFATLFAQLAGTRITHRWGGLQSFTADDLPLVGQFDSERNLWGIAGFCGRGNCHSDVGTQFLAGRIAGATSDIERRFGYLFELMRPDRESARWRPWKSVHD